jgi:uncharacterized protein YerC
MTQVSRIPIRKEIENRMFEVFLESIAMVHTKEQVEKLVEDLLSPTEKIMLTKRLSIALLLLKQYDQRLISKLLHVGLETVSKVSRALRSGSGGYSMVVSSIMRQEKYQAFLTKIDDLLADLFPPYHRDWSSWRKKRWEEKIRRTKPF